MIITRAPFRITLGGGGTDLPSFYKKHGGLVFTMAIDKYIYLNFKPSIIDTAIRLQCYNPEIVQDINKLKHSRAREALKRYGVVHSAEVNSIADLPASSGLGSSGSYLVALLSALRHYKGKGLDPDAIAEEACDIEINVLQEPVGKQDQYIASHGGIKVLKIDKDGRVEINKVGINYSDVASFLGNTHVYYTGNLRSASDVLREQDKMSSDVERRMGKIKELSYKFIESFGSCNFDDYGALLDEHWDIKKGLSNKVSLSKVDKIYKIAKDEYGVLGGKIIGAGGGGFLMLYSPTGSKKLEKFMEESGMPRLHYNVDPNGCSLLNDLRTYDTMTYKDKREGAYDLWEKEA